TRRSSDLLQAEVETLKKEGEDALHERIREAFVESEQLAKAKEELNTKLEEMKKEMDTLQSLKDELRREREEIDCKMENTKTEIDHLKRLKSDIQRRKEEFEKTMAEKEELEKVKSRSEER